MEQSGINIEVLKATVPNFKDQDKAQIEKYAASYTVANNENEKILKSHGIEIKKPSQAIILAYTPEEKDFNRELKLAEEMGFIDAYKQNPRHLSQPIEEVIKRMAKAEANGINYKNEKGIYASFIFSERAFNYVLSQSEGIKKESPSNAPINSDTPIDSETMAEVKENALRVLEAFAMDDEKDRVFARLDAIWDKG